LGSGPKLLREESGEFYSLAAVGNFEFKAGLDGRTRMMTADGQSGRQHRRLGQRCGGRAGVHAATGLWSRRRRRSARQPITCRRIGLLSLYRSPPERLSISGPHHGALAIGDAVASHRRCAERQNGESNEVYRIAIACGNYSLVVIALLPAATRPHYGGVLRVQILDALPSLDTGEPNRDRITSLVAEMLVDLDDRGVARPKLATAWQHDSEAKRWSFTLRQRVAFHDGSLLNATVAASVLSAAMKNLRSLPRAAACSSIPQLPGRT